MKNINRFLCILLAAAALLLCSACGGLAPDPNLEVLEFTLAASDPAQLAELDQYPNLQTADLRGSTCYDAIEAYIAAHPQVAVEYDVQLGNARHDPGITGLTLEDGSYAYEELLENLAYLKGLNTLSLPKTSLSAQQIAQLGERYPGLDLSCTYLLDGKEIDGSTETLDLSHMDSAQLAASLETLSRLSSLKEIQLMDADGASQLTKADVKQLMTAVPGATVHYSFELYGNTVSTTDESLEFIKVPIGNEGVTQVREALDIMPLCTYLKMDTCEVDNEVMDQLRTDYPNILVSWRIFMPHCSVLTDDTVLRVTHQLEGNNADPLKYCTEAVYVDFGHNPKLSDISFMSGMTKLECIILSGSSVKDLTPLANCNSMVWVELCFCGHLKDLSPLAGKDSIRFLNVSHTLVDDLTVPNGLNLERFNCMNSRVSVADADAFKESHPNCISVFEGRQPYGYGWRYNDHGYTFFDYYLNMRKVFKYDEG